MEAVVIVVEVLVDEVKVEVAAVVADVVVSVVVEGATQINKNILRENLTWSLAKRMKGARYFLLDYLNNIPFCLCSATFL